MVRRLAGGIKNEADEWNIAGHADRIVRIGDYELAVFAQLYDEPAHRRVAPVFPHCTPDT